jgi:hypothetical protein
MLSDRFNFFGLVTASRILLSIAGAICVFVIVANINPGQNYWGFVALAFILQMGMAFYDTCTPTAWALDITIH